jgi:hypothetical protein
MRRLPNFTLQYDSAKIPFLVSEYLRAQGNQDQAMEVSGKRMAQGQFTRSDFETVCRWKSPRKIGLLAENTDAQIRLAIDNARIASNPRDAVHSLVVLHGVGVKMATAILTAMFPDDHTVLDFRGLEALGVGNGESVNLYVLYLGECVRLARQYGVTLRDFDRANWQWSKLKSRSKTCAPACAVTERQPNAACI